MSITPNDPAHFEPSLRTYTGQGAFRFWCQQVLPLTFDDSLSYYELLNKVVTYLNNTISDVANVEENVSALNDAYVKLQSYVNNYFDSLDVQKEINNKLDEMADNGTFNELFNSIIQTQTDNTVTQWMNDNLIPIGETAVLDASLSLSDAAAKSNSVRENALLHFDSTYNLAGITHINSSMSLSSFNNDCLFTHIGTGENSKPQDCPPNTLDSEPGFFVHFNNATKNTGIRHQFYYNISKRVLWHRYKTAGGSASWQDWKELNSLTFNNIIAPAYSDSTTYHLGDYVIYNEHLYRCTATETIAGDFNASDWSNTSVYAGFLNYSYLGSGNNLNNVVGKNKIFMLGYSDTATNSPNNNNGIKYLLNFGNDTIAGQIFIHCDEGKIYIRRLSDGNQWTRWMGEGRYLFEKNIVPYYDSETTYNTGDLVIYGTTNANEKIYRCINDNTTNVLPSVTASWSSAILTDIFSRYAGSAASKNLKTLKGKTSCYLIGYSAHPYSNITPESENFSTLYRTGSDYDYEPDATSGIKVFVNLIPSNATGVQLYYNSGSGKLWIRGYSATTTWYLWKDVTESAINEVNNLKQFVEQIICAKVFSSSNRYACGDLCWYNDNLYVCNSGSKDISFNSSKWDLINLDDYINNITVIRSPIVKKELVSYERTAFKAGTKFKILNYNVAHFDNNSDVKIYNYDNQKYYNLKQLITKEDYDAICMPEYSSNIGTDDSNNTMSAYNYLLCPIYTCHSSASMSKASVASKGVFINETKWLDQAITNIPVEGSESTTVARFVRTIVRKDNIDLYVYCTHLSDNNFATRKAQIEAILNWITNNDNPTYYIIAGDFNTGVQDASNLESEIQWLKSLKTSNNLQLANGEYFGWRRTHRLTDFGGIDNALISTNMTLLRFNVLGDWYTKLYSDHYPCEIEICVTETETWS